MRIYFLFIFFSISLIYCGDKPKQFTNEEMKQYREPMIRVNKIMVDNDSILIANYCKRRSWTMQVSKTGFWYRIENPTNILSIVEGNLVSLRYKIELLDGTICYSSDSLGVKTFRVGKSSEPQGLDQAVRLLKKNDKMILILPPHLAFGLIGDEKRIPARSILVYHIEVVNVVK